jgi:D-sedoheptulose 7-phosphate isomerase
MTSSETSIIRELAESGARLRTEFFEANLERVAHVSKTIANRLVRGGKVLFFGNGGSAADSQHLAAEFVSRFRMERPPLPAIALTTDTSVLTAVGNDYGFDDLFSRQVRALAGEEDVVVGITTSGSSPNVIRALESAGEKGAYRVGLTGSQGGAIVDSSETVFQVPSDVTALIQEIHIAAGHAICRMTEYYLFEAIEELDLE